MKKAILGLGVPPDISEYLKKRFTTELYEYVLIPSVEKFLNDIKNYHTDLIFIYSGLEGLNDCEQLCIALRADPNIETVPVVILSAANENTQEKIKLFNTGLIDGYLNPSISLEEIGAYANVFLQRRCLEEELQTKNEILNRLSITDELTKLYNRRYLIQTLEQEIRKIRRYEYQLSVMMLDVDYYKALNDKHGHSTGDVALEKLANLVRKSFRSLDVACRYGGDEIVVVFPFTNFEGAFEASERFRKKVEESNFGEAEPSIKLTVSIGLVSVESKDECSVDSLLHILDKQLYQAKEAGRNKTCGGMYKNLSKSN